MADIALGGINPVSYFLPTQSTTKTTPAESGGAGFGKLVEELLGANNKANVTADAAIKDLAVGNAEDLHTVSLAVAQADLSFRLILEIRNRLTEAFQEVTRIQV
jgi:flagellar hook-basal body complex protein FliE